MSTIRVYPGSIRPTTDSSYGDTRFQIEPNELYRFHLLIFCPIASCRLKTQNTAKENVKKCTNNGKTSDLFAHVSISSTANTASSLNLSQALSISLKSIVQSGLSWSRHNCQKPSKFSTANYEKIWIDLHSCRFQVSR